MAFLCALPCDSGKERCIKASDTHPLESCRFIASILEEGNIALRVNGTEGKYLQLHNVTLGNVTVYPIKSTGDGVDVSAHFAVEVVSPVVWTGARSVYLKANNGKYLGKNGDNIVADYDTLQQAIQMTVLEVC